MSYTVVENFSGGVDRTRPIYALKNGQLFEGINGHISRGGDFEKRKAFVKKYELPSGTFGLLAIGTALYTFGSDASPAVPTGINYQRLQHETAGYNMVEMVYADVFEGKAYVIARFWNGTTYVNRHFYDGTRITDWTEGVSGKPSAIGTIAKTHKRKVYSAAGSILYFCDVDEPTSWNWIATGSPGASSGVGAGFVNMANHQTGSDDITALGVYKSNLVAMSRRVIQIWQMEADPDANYQVQVVLETGTRSPNAVRGFGDYDMLYLSDSGIRSIRSINYQTTAGVLDIGTPIDPLVREHVLGLTDTQVQNACSIVEPVDGRFWLALGDKVFVFTHFQSKSIAAWSWYEPGFEISHMVSINDRIYARSGFDVYLYGGDDNNTYGDDYDVVCQMPFITNNKPGSYKQVTGCDIAAQGVWDVEFLVDPSDLTQKVSVGEMDGFTFLDANTGALGYTTHIAPRLVHRGAGYASLSSVAVYFLPGAESS